MKPKPADNYLKHHHPWCKMKVYSLQQDRTCTCGRDALQKELEDRVSHFIPVDFNQPSVCGLSKAEWKYGTSNWEWVNCPDCLSKQAAKPVQIEMVMR
jgi:hypothetical protein